MDIFTKARKALQSYSRINYVNKLYESVVIDDLSVLKDKINDNSFIQFIRNDIQQKV